MLKVRLSVLSFMEFAVWGAYLTSLGNFLFKNGLGDQIGWFYAIQGIVSLFMPTIVGIIADRWIQAQKMLSICHLIAGLFMLLPGSIVCRLEKWNLRLCSCSTPCRWHSSCPR